MVTSSPFPTCSSPSQLVSMDAGLKSSETHSGTLENCKHEQTAEVPCMHGG